MQCMFEEDARDSLIKYLGYVQTEEKVEEKEEEKEEEKKEVAASITAEDLFASAPMTPSAEAQETVQESKETPKETSSSPVTSPRCWTRRGTCGVGGGAEAACDRGRLRRRGGGVFPLRAFRRRAGDRDVGRRGAGGADDGRRAGAN